MIDHLPPRRAGAEITRNLSLRLCGCNGGLCRNAGRHRTITPVAVGESRGIRAIALRWTASGWALRFLLEREGKGVVFRLLL